MAKTVTQVREEKRKLQESFAPTQEKLEAIHAQQMQDIGYDPNIARITYETIRAKVKQADEQAKKRANTIDVLTKKESRLDDVKAKRPAQSEAEKAADDAERNLKNYENSPAVKQRESSKTQLAGPHPQAQGNSAPQKDETLIRLQQEAEMARRNYESAQASENDRNIYNQDMADINAMSDEQLENLANYAAVREQGRTGNPITDLIYLPAKKREAAGDLLNTYGEKRLNELAETYSRSNAEREKEQVQEAAKEASTGAVGGTLTTIGGIAASPVSGWMGIKGRLDELGNATGRYSSLQSFVPGDTMNVYTDTAKQNVTQQIAGDGSNVLRKGAALLYQAGVGAAESATKAIVLGPQVAAATSAMNAYSRALADASEKGATAEQAVLLATSSAAMDYVMDKIPMDKLFSLAQSGSTNALKAAFKQAGIEMTTEGASFLGSQLLEIGTLQQSSEYAQSVQNYVDLGYSPEDAQHQAAKDLALQAGQQILVAGISGGVSAGVSTAVGNHRQKAADALLQEESTAAQQEPTPQGQPAQQPVEPQQAAPQEAETAAVQEAAMPVMPEKGEQSGNTSPIDTVSRMAEDIGRGATQRQQEAKNNMQSVTDQVAAMTGGGAEPNPQSQPVDDTAGTPPRNFTGKEQYENLLTDDNVKPGRASDVRQDEVPEYDQNGRRVSDVAKNLMGSKNTTDEAAGQIEDLIQSGVFSYDKKTNRQSLEEAYADISARGGAAVREEISRHLKDGTIQDGDVAKAATLVNQYIQSGDQDAANDMMADLSLLAQKSGRNLQLFSLIRKMTPEGQLSAIQATADRFLNSNGKTKGKGISADIPADLKNEYLEAARSGDKKRISDATNAIAQKVGAQCPATFAEKWDTWRYMCMLGNASTNIRNVAGNFFMKPYAAAKDELAAIMEAGMQKAGLIDKDQRTKAVKTDKELLQWAKADTKTEDAQNALRYSAKVGADVSQDIMQENRRIFEHDSMEKIRKATEWAPSEGDMIFKNGYYAKYLANFLTARGVTRADIEAGKVDADIMSQARQYAVDNAYINTFNDSNKFSDAISSVGKLKSSDNWVSRAFGRVVDGIIPFRRTPANILVRFKEYSPVEFVSAAAKLAMAKKGHGEYTAADFCNSIASGLTGTAAMVIGAAVANGIFDKKGNGVRLVGKATDEEKLQGKQDYSIEVTYNGKTTSYTIDWAAPANLPLFVGANVYSAMQKSYDNGDDALGVILNLADAGKDVLEPMLSLSCLSSLDDLVQSVKYAEDGSAVFKLVAAPATSYLTQAIPSLLRQTASAFNENKQTTFANDERKPVRDIQRTVSNIPFAGNALGLKTDKIDVWGQKQSTGSIGKRVFDSYLNPSKISAVTSDAATDEISRLAKTEYGEGVVPEVAPKTLTYTDTSGETHKDVRLTKEQWEKYATVKGQTSKKILNRLVASTDYAKMTDAGKAAVVKLVYEYADKTGAIDAIADHDGYPETWMEEAKRSGNPGAYLVSKVNNQQMQSAMDQLTSAWAHGSDRKAARVSLESTYESYQKSSDSVKTAVMDAAEGVTKKYLEARAQGFSSDAALSVIKQVQSIPEDHRDTRGYQLEAVARTPGLRESDMDKAMKLYLPEYDPDDKKPNVSRLRYDYIRKELGYSPKDYAAFQKAHSIADSEYGNDNGGTSKDEIRAAFEAYGYDQETADKIYTVLWGTSSRAGKAVKSKILEIYG